MITGDNIYTAINVGYSSGILENDENLWVCKLDNKKLKWEFSSWENRIKKNDNIDENYQSVVSSS